MTALDLDGNADGIFPHLICWWELTDAEYGDEIARLRPFVEVFGTTMNVTARYIPDCWAEHPDIVVILGALRDYSSYAFYPSQMGIEPSNFLRTWFMLRDELHAINQTLTCTQTRHNPPVPRRWKEPEE